MEARWQRGSLLGALLYLGGRLCVSAATSSDALRLTAERPGREICSNQAISACACPTR